MNDTLRRLRQILSNSGITSGALQAKIRLAETTDDYDCEPLLDASRTLLSMIEEMGEHEKT